MTSMTSGRWILPSPNRISATMRAKLVFAVPGGPSSTMWFSLVERGLLALGGQQLVDLNLGAPHRDLLLGSVQPDQLVEPGLGAVEHLVLLVGQVGRGALRRGWSRWPGPTCRCGWRWSRRR